MKHKLVNQLAVVAAASVATFASVANAAVIHPTAVTVTVPTGAAASTSTTAGTVYTDDVLLDSITFGSTTISGAASFSAVKRFQVLTGRAHINAEYGDKDTASDGDSNPFAKAGVIAGQAPTATERESVTPAIQDAALLNAFNSRSLTEMSDGEDNQEYSFKLLFANGLNDDSSDPDITPELLFVERNGNDANIWVQAIIGGTFGNPEYSNEVKVGSDTYWSGSKILVNTVEIDSPQLLSFGGFDLNDFGLAAGTTVYGLKVRAKGADLNGMFLASADPTRFTPALVPVPASLPLLAGAMGALALLRRRRKA
ncbi:exosortase-dependent surface protein XDP2 [Rubellimicrobium roseum]|uniref:VPLPA-CTERM sorting domain-containing protein n=1 Tax=Rubellimicrobium roseum TaxID=687525 RepID=A0A5C4N9V4_9RHOB|nr:exosortase-dependent surface protein XDP2 [Rubellimicrobium roseum]TNC63750.1 VPLPA-CTERM sorting domain-containing protein [Rubellimicrobium roseum]